MEESLLLRWTLIEVKLEITKEDSKWMSGSKKWA